MAPKTKIVVFKAKELIYTGIFILLGILLILLLIFMFAPSGRKKSTDAQTAKYIDGTYSSMLTLGEHHLEVLVTVKNNKASSVSMKHLNKSIQTMYPLIKPAMERINKELPKVSSVDEITFEDETQYTNTVLKQSIKNALKKAEP